MILQKEKEMVAQNERRNIKEMNNYMRDQKLEEVRQSRAEHIENLY